MATDLIILKPTEISDILKDGEKLEVMLKRIEKSARDEMKLHDIQTKEGRAAIRSLAALIPRTKAPLKTHADDLTASAKKTITDIGDRRKIFDARIDALKLEVRKDLTEYEDAEKARVEAHKDMISNWENFVIAATSEAIESDISDLAVIATTENEFQEYAGPAEISKMNLLNRMRAELQHVKAREDADALAEKNRIELEELRTQKAKADKKAADEQKIRDDEQAERDRTAKEAADKEAADKEAENQALRDQLAAQQKTIDDLAAASKPEPAATEPTAEPELHRASSVPMAAPDVPTAEPELHRASSVPMAAPDVPPVVDPELFDAGVFTVDEIPDEVVIIFFSGGKKIEVIYGALTRGELG